MRDRDLSSSTNPLVRYCHFGVSPVNYSDSDQISPNHKACHLLYVHHLMMSAFPNARNMRTVMIDWSVKGYHHFKIRPHPDITMLLEREDGNRYDPFARKVMMPILDRIPRNLHGVVTRPLNQMHHQSQTVFEIAGKYSLHFKLANRCLSGYENLDFVVVPCDLFSMFIFCLASAFCMFKKDAYIYIYSCIYIVLITVYGPIGDQNLKSSLIGNQIP